MKKLSSRKKGKSKSRSKSSQKDFLQAQIGNKTFVSKNGIIILDNK